MVWVLSMDYYAWLKDNDEFPSLTSEKGWDDCRLDDDDDNDKVLLLDTGDDSDDWQIIKPYTTTTTTTYADIVKRLARTNGPFHKWQVDTFSAKPKIKTGKRPVSSTTQLCLINNKMVTEDDNDAFDASELHTLRKSKSRRRYLGDAWILQHRVTVLTRLGYGSSIQNDDVDQYYEIDGPRPLRLEEVPLDKLTFIHFWRYVCKEDPEPEVDRLRKSWVKSLTLLTDNAYSF